MEDVKKLQVGRITTRGTHINCKVTLVILLILSYILFNRVCKLYGLFYDKVRMSNFYTLLHTLNVLHISLLLTSEYV